MNNKVKRKANKETKGITLIALVITIIIMLILAGVAISMAIDSNGLFSKANTAGESWNTAVENEQSEIQDLLDIIDGLNLPAGWDAKKIASTVTQTSEVAGITKERIVPIPKGYTVSEISTESTNETTIAGGLVIYEIPKGATVDWTNRTITIDEATSNLQETCNQYVWIPVDDINYMVMCKSNGSATKADGKTPTKGGVTTCKLALQTNGTLKCETHDSTELCGRLYATDSTTTDTSASKTYTTNMTFTEATRASQTWDTSSYHEPDIVSDYDNDSNTSYLTAAGVSSANELLTQLTSDFTNMATSVAKYGGFYVSRYEVGKDNEGNIVSQKNKKVLVTGTRFNSVKNYDSYTYKGVNDKGDNNMWYGLYNTLKNDTGVDTNVVNTHMIWGSQYDQVINFLGTNPNNGPQTGHTDRQSNKQKLTGSNGDDIMSNIYDLEGNNGELTAQANSTSSRTYRGDNFSFVAYSSNVYPASKRSNVGPNNTYCNYGSRYTLYIK